jgi:nucleolar protein 14
LADDEVLTHRGQTLSEIEKFDDPRSDDDEEEEGRGTLGCKCSDYSVSLML